MNNKRKYIPLICMLTAGATASIITLVFGYDSSKALTIVAISLVVFYILGNILKSILDYFERSIANLEKLEREQDTMDDIDGNTGSVKDNNSEENVDSSK